MHSLFWDALYIIKTALHLLWDAMYSGSTYLFEMIGQSTIIYLICFNEPLFIQLLKEYYIYVKLIMI